MSQLSLMEVQSGIIERWHEFYQKLSELEPFFRVHLDGSVSLYVFDRAFEKYKITFDPDETKQIRVHVKHGNYGPFPQIAYLAWDSTSEELSALILATLARLWGMEDLVKYIVQYYPNPRDYYHE